MATEWNFPRQMLSFKAKNKEWRKSHLLWASQKTFFNYNLVRKSVTHKKINYDLLNGKLHISDLQMVLNPDQIEAGYIPDKLQHYPIMNSKLRVLSGEESKRVFDFKVVVTNPNAITEIEDNKKNELLQRLQEIISETSTSEDEFNNLFNVKNRRPDKPFTLMLDNKDDIEKYANVNDKTKKIINKKNPVGIAMPTGFFVYIFLYFTLQAFQASRYNRQNSASWDSSQPDTG